MTNPDTNAVIVIDDPSSALIGGRQKGRPNMKRENHLINYAQTHPKSNEYLKEVMKYSIAKMVRFTTESGMVECASNQTQVTPCYGCSTKNCFLPPRYSTEEKIQSVKKQG
jgi:hypothetical protein